MYNKKLFYRIIGSLMLFVLLSAMNACDILDICGGYGYLKLENKSSNTIQKIRIDGVNYGTISPGESDTYELTEGNHLIETINKKTGKRACCAFEVIIIECDTQAYSCSG